MVQRVGKKAKSKLNVSSKAANRNLRFYVAICYRNGRAWHCLPNLTAHGAGNNARPMGIMPICREVWHSVLTVVCLVGMLRDIKKFYDKFVSKQCR